MLATVVHKVDDNSGRRRSKANQLTLGASALGVPRAAEVKGLKQIGLAGAISAVHNRQTVAEMGLGAGVGPKITQLQASDAHNIRC